MTAFHFRVTRIVALLAIAVLGLGARSASATPFRFEIAGSVAQADAHGLFAVGDAVNLILDVDLFLPLTNPWFPSAVASASGSGVVGGDTVVVSSGQITAGSDATHSFRFSFAAAGPTSGNLALDLIDMRPGAYEWAGVPEILALGPSDVQSLQLEVRRTVVTGTLTQISWTRATVDVTSFVVVPEPGTAALLGIGLVALAGRGAARLRPAPASSRPASTRK